MTATVTIVRGGAYDKAKYKQSVPPKGLVREFPELTEAMAFAVTIAFRTLDHDPDNTYSSMVKEDGWYFLDICNLDDDPSATVVAMDFGVGTRSEVQMAERDARQAAAYEAWLASKKLPAGHVMVNGQLVREDELEA